MEHLLNGLSWALILVGAVYVPVSLAILVVAVRAS